MLPIVVFDKEKDSGKHINTRDKRKHRLCIWKEIRVSTVSNPDAADTYYGVALEGPFGVGLMMSDCCKFKGMNNETYIHAIADGASWIADQYEKQFGSQCKFTLDSHHACEYLTNRIDQLDYKEAIKRNLPIGSGEVESAHRHILQKRLKIPGACWRLERAEEMAQLRANNRWGEFWEEQCA